MGIDFVRKKESRYYNVGTVNGKTLWAMGAENDGYWAEHARRLSFVTDTFMPKIINHYYISYGAIRHGMPLDLDFT